MKTHASTLAPKPTVGPHHLGTANRLVLGLLHSPLHFLLDPGICELTFAGRRTGRQTRLPVIYARDGSEVVVLVGNAAAKRWWRNFHAPHPVTVTLGGETRTGTGRVLPTDDPRYANACDLYWSHHHGTRLLPGDRLIHITLDEESS